MSLFNWLRLLVVSTMGLLSGFLLSGCGKDSRDTIPEVTTFSGFQVTFDPSVPAEQKALLQTDLKIAEGLNLPSDEAALFGLQDMSAPNITGWLGKRVRYITGENFKYLTETKVLNQSAQYSPSLVDSMRFATSTNDTVKTIMFNLGGHLYLIGKKYNALLEVPISGQKITVKSPRVGIFQIGEGLFTINRIKSSPIGSLANSIIRLGTLYHEARHDDGNGTNTAFPHAICPSGVEKVKAYANKAACEDNLNGPYAIEAAYLRGAIKACSSCTTKEREGLRTFISDSESRVFSTAQMRDSRAEINP